MFLEGILTLPEKKLRTFWQHRVVLQIKDMLHLTIPPVKAVKLKAMKTALRWKLVVLVVPLANSSTISSKVEFRGYQQ